MNCHNFYWRLLANVKSSEESDFPKTVSLPKINICFVWFVWFDTMVKSTITSSSLFSPFHASYYLLLLSSIIDFVLKRCTLPCTTANNFWLGTWQPNRNPFARNFIKSESIYYYLSKSHIENWVIVHLSWQARSRTWFSLRDFKFARKYLLVTVQI